MGVICFLAAASAAARDTIDWAKPGPSLTTSTSDIWISDRSYSQHLANNISLTVTNWGFWGFGYYEWLDYVHQGEICRKGSEFPRGSTINQVQSAQLWVGGIKGSDTLVTISLEYNFEEYWEWEWWPVMAPIGQAIIGRTNTNPESEGYEDAVSNEDILCEYMDLIVDYSVTDPIRGTPHMPIEIEVHQYTYAWSVAGADDFILFDMTIENTGDEPVEEMYVGILSRPSVGLLVGDNHAFTYANDNICGFKKRIPSPFVEGIEDTVNMMWGANNDGDPVDGVFVDEIVFDPDAPQDWVKSATSGHAYFFLDYPGRNSGAGKILSYNWWSPYWENPYDWGPRHRDDFRDFGTGGLGWPFGDVNRYYMLSNGEIDYDMLYTPLIGFDHSVWLPPPAEISELASTGRLPAPPNLLSVGPFDLPAGHSMKVPFAFVCGENIHLDPANIDNLPGNLGAFYSNLDFSDLYRNVTYARWVYDNFGRDTDGDGYAGEYAIVNGDTVYYSGDGVPDWSSCLPPPAPDFWLNPTINGIRVRFNGTRSETERDDFTRKVDFEGYRVYCGRDDRLGSLAMVASYDRENYDKYVLVGGDTGKFKVRDDPFSLDSLRCLYAPGDDPCNNIDFDPLIYTRASPLYLAGFKDSIFYFTKHDFNTSDLGVTTPIRKIYPNEPDPSVYHPDSIPEEAYTDDGYLKYYEYEMTIENLMPTVAYYVNVTALDFGDARFGVLPLESSPGIGIKSAFPVGPSDATAEGSSKIYVYPNPYRIDAEYRRNGFEGRDQEDRPDYRVRALNFANLPAKCTIYIYSLDGDLVRRLDHDIDPSDPNSSHDTWNLITRNTQMVVSGLYYWVVEAEDGSIQMGKFVIIM